jgi:hypothetical protein
MSEDTWNRQRRKRERDARMGVPSGVDSSPDAMETGGGLEEVSHLCQWLYTSDKGECSFSMLYFDTHTLTREPRAGGCSPLSR